jgi:hypothetical protein
MGGSCVLFYLLLNYFILNTPHRGEEIQIQILAQKEFFEVGEGDI